VKILYVCTELYPLLKTGGLADVGAALPTALQAAGCHVRLLLPAFAAIAAGVRADGPALLLPNKGGPAVLRTLAQPPRLIPGHVIESGQLVYLLDAPALYQREGGPYQDASGQEWSDNAARFALLGWAAAALGNGTDPHWQPDLVHAHDWHAGLTPLYLKLLANGRPPKPSVFTVHNLAYQGLFPAGSCAELGLPESLFTIDGLEYHGLLSFMKAGLQFADAITTVSPRYAREITTPEQGCGLDGALRARGERLSGILNGVDYELWNPATDPLLNAHFDGQRMIGKARVKRALQRALGLEERADALLFVAVSRLSEQKGLQLLPEILPELIERGGQLVILGSGDPAIEHALREALACHPGQAALRIAYDEALAHRIIAAADVILVPSRFEPCGLTQLYGLRYGALPLVHAVGGLADTVTDCSLEAIDDGSASGFVFHEFSAEALRGAMRRAFALRRRPSDWKAVQGHAMQQRFDWKAPAHAYRTLYQQLLKPAAVPASTVLS
jgi:starch synthase